MYDNQTNFYWISGIEGYTPEKGGNYEHWDEENEIEKGRKCPVAFNEIGGKCYFYGYFKLNW